jgi:hypothetical protein
MNTITYLKSHEMLGDDTDIQKIRDDFKTYGIKVSYSPNEKNRRVIFSATKQFRQSNEFDGFVSECNGLLLKAGSWEPLVIPPRTFKSNITVDLVNAGLARGEYEIFEAQDGTMVSLYYFDNRWRMSTVQGFDVTHLKWNGKIYNQAFKEILSAKGVAIDEFYDSLNKSQCHTFCFTHPDFHPFWQGKTRDELMNLTFVQSTSATGEVSLVNTFDPTQIGEQKLGNPFTNVKDIFKELPKTLRKYTNSGKACFGYILRYRSGVDITNENAMNSHLFLESHLLQTIRRLFYNGSYNMIIKEKKFNRSKYIVVKSFLDTEANGKFIHLFPQYQDDFNELEKISIKLIKNIIDLHTIKSERSNTPESTDESGDIFASSSEFLLNALTQVFTLNLKARDSVRIISSFILNVKFIDVFYRLFTERVE